MMNILLDAWATTMWRACWQGGLVVLVVWSICRLIPSMPARFQCWFWRLAILKFMVALVPSLLNVPLLPAHRAPEHVAVVTTLVPTHPDPPGAVEPEWQNQPLPVPMPMRVPVLPVVLFLRLDHRGRMLPGSPPGGFLWHDTTAKAGPQHRLHVLDRTTGNPGTVVRLPILCPGCLRFEGDGSPMLVGIFRPAVLLPCKYSCPAERFGAKDGARA